MCEQTNCFHVDFFIRHNARVLQQSFATKFFPALCQLASLMIAQFQFHAFLIQLFFEDFILRMQIQDHIMLFAGQPAIAAKKWSIAFSRRFFRKFISRWQEEQILNLNPATSPKDNKKSSEKMPLICTTPTNLHLFQFTH